MPYSVPLTLTRPAHGVCAISRAALEAVEHGFRAGRRDREDGPVPCAVCAPIFGRTVERAIDVDETRKRISAVSRAAFETMKQGFRPDR